jgi:hypothetical protein
MAAASTVTRQNVMNCILRGQAITPPTATYVSLHTADPGPAGANETGGAAWPGYARRDASVGAGGVSAGWSAADTNGVCRNAKQITFPNNNGAASITVTHYGVWDAPTGGNLITYGVLSTPRTIAVGDVILFDINTLTVSLT